MCERHMLKKKKQFLILRVAEYLIETLLPPNLENRVVIYTWLTGHLLKNCTYCLRSAL